MSNIIINKMLKKLTLHSMGDTMRDARLMLNILLLPILEKLSADNLIKDAVKEADIVTLCT